MLSNRHQHADRKQQHAIAAVVADSQRLAPDSAVEKPTV